MFCIVLIQISVGDFMFRLTLHHEVHQKPENSQTVHYLEICVSV